VVSEDILDSVGVDGTLLREFYFEVCSWWLAGTNRRLWQLGSFISILIL